MSKLLHAPLWRRVPAPVASPVVADVNANDNNDGSIDPSAAASTMKRKTTRNTTPNIPRSSVARELASATAAYNHALSQFEALQQSPADSRTKKTLLEMRRALEDMGISKERVTALKNLDALCERRASIMDWTPFELASQLVKVDASLYHSWIVSTGDSISASFLEAAMNERALSQSDPMLLCGSTGICAPISRILDFHNFIQHIVIASILHDPSIRQLNGQPDSSVRLAVYSHLLQVTQILHDSFRDLNMMGAIVTALNGTFIKSLMLPLKKLDKRYRHSIDQWSETFSLEDPKSHTYQQMLIEMTAYMKDAASVINNVPLERNDAVSQKPTLHHQILVIPWLRPHLMQLRYALTQYSSLLFPINRHIHLGTVGRKRYQYTVEQMISQLSAPGQKIVSEVQTLIDGCFLSVTFPTLSPLNMRDVQTRKKVASIPHGLTIDLNDLKSDLKMQHWILSRVYMNDEELRNVFGISAPDLDKLENETDESSDDDQDTLVEGRRFPLIDESRANEILSREIECEPTFDDDELEDILPSYAESQDFVQKKDDEEEGDFDELAIRLSRLSNFE